MFLFYFLLLSVGFRPIGPQTPQIGQYKIGVANYSRADGRKATVQVASWNNGVLGTKSVTLGVPTGSTPAQYLFSVLISQDMETGKYSVSVN